ncbi:MAG TPA: BlaI/MecI/CopY family transcriptional regulator [Candidatus Hydrogenedentes bacterium]|nr:BlaI/MecI/CopY family transcriptional regulator [Candidatus Hydrogenedentota bacterium]
MPQEATQSEMLVLRVLTEHAPATAKEVHAALLDETGWALSTVITFLRRLEAKDLVTHTNHQGQRAFVFQPTRKARTAHRRVLRDLVDRLFGGNPLPMVSALLDEADLDESQLEELRQLIEDRTSARRRQ